jgi:hypothetical protein
VKSFTFLPTTHYPKVLNILRRIINKFYELHGLKLIIREMFLTVFSERVHNSITFYTFQKHDIMAKKMSLNFKTSEITAKN